MRLTLVVLSLCLGACATPPPIATGKLPQPGSWRAADDEHHLARTQELLLETFALVGTRYKYGGDSPESGFDCSGLVQYVFNRALGWALPRNTHEISRVGDPIGRDELQPGDLVFFDTLQRPFSHVGIYVGEQRFIHAPSNGGRVELVNMTDRYWQSRYNGARRMW